MQNLPAVITVRGDGNHGGRWWARRVVATIAAKGGSRGTRCGRARIPRDVTYVETRDGDDRDGMRAHDP